MKNFLIVFFASYLPYILIVIAVYLLFTKEKNWRQRLYIFSVFALSAILSRGLITEIIRFFYYHPRPSGPGNSFPSGHMTFYFVLALAVFFLLNKKWGWFFIASVIIIGLARVLAGIHWYSDIAGGILIAAACYFFVEKILLPKKF
jgi:undecaprenyl-diphosphatase